MSQQIFAIRTRLATSCLRSSTTYSRASLARARYSSFRRIVNTRHKALLASLASLKYREVRDIRRLRKSRPKSLLTPGASNDSLINVSITSAAHRPQEDSQESVDGAERLAHDSSGRQVDVSSDIQSINAVGTEKCLRTNAQIVPRTEDRNAIIKSQHRPGTRDEDTEGDGSSVVDVPLMDIDFVLERNEVPSPTAYPNAPARWFKWHDGTVKTAIHEICQRSLMQISSDLEFQRHRTVSGGQRKTSQTVELTDHYWRCSLKIDISGLFQSEVTGEGTSKSSAQSAAWLRIFSHMYLHGILKQILPSKFGSREDSTPPEEDITPPKEKSTPPGKEDSIGSKTVGQQATRSLKLSELDMSTKEMERDGKLQIYNYAASLGLVPEFYLEVIGNAQTSLRLKQYKASIKLGGIMVAAIANDADTAEIVAAMRFKVGAQKRHALHQRSSAAVDEGGFDALSIVSAKQFWTFYRTQQEELSLEVDIDEDRIGSTIRQKAQVKVDGQPIGDPVFMLHKKNAIKVAYLVAAIHTARANPGLLAEFKQTLNPTSSTNKGLAPMTPVKVSISHGQIYTMANALVAVYDKGLPAERPDPKAAHGGDQLPQIQVRSRWRAARNATMDKTLLEQQARFETHPSFKALRSEKAALPVNGWRNKLISMIKNNSCIIVSAPTGSGKTTQIPQILFDQAVREGSGSSCNIICTQPRRLAATSVARRVAEERGELLRRTVGYQVRFDAQLTMHPHGINYCTTGILLQRLQADWNWTLDTVSHIIIDEVHERSIGIDFLLVMIRKALEQRKSMGKTVPKIVLMSATLDSELFANYFGRIEQDGNLIPCPTLHLPGRTFHVRERYLGSILQDVFTTHGDHVSSFWKADRQSRRFLDVETALSVAESGIIDWRRENELTPSASPEEELMPTSLIAVVVAHIIKTTKDGTILVFLPGLREILAVRETLTSQSILGLDLTDSRQFQICLLHSSLPKEQQAEIFEPPSSGSRRIILSTNIAETSITVPDVKFVVDTGKLREKRFDPQTNVSRLENVWESKANMKQRAGRAGRVADGDYYALFSKERADSFEQVRLPEIRRSELADICLSVKALGFEGSVESFLAQAIEPPAKEAVDAAVKLLIGIDALTAEEELTPLGRLLSTLPLHPSLGKMVLLGIIFRCLDPMIILGATVRESDLFIRPIGERSQAQQRQRADFAGQRQSDHIAILEAFKNLRLVQHRYGQQAVFREAAEKYLNLSTFRTVQETGKQIEQSLVRSKLIPPLTTESEAVECQLGGEAFNTNSHNEALIKCLLLAGLQPNLAVKRTVHRGPFRTSSENTVLIASTSFNKERVEPPVTHPEGTLVTYSSKYSDSGEGMIMLRDITVVSPLMAMLFGGQLEDNVRDSLSMENWLNFRFDWHLKPPASKHIMEYRKALDKVLLLAFDTLSSAEGASIEDPMREQFIQSLVKLLRY